MGLSASSPKSPSPLTGFLRPVTAQIAIANPTAKKADSNSSNNSNSSNSKKHENSRGSLGHTQRVEELKKELM
jgi:hypothetical protein